MARDELQWALHQARGLNYNKPTTRGKDRNYRIKPDLLGIIHLSKWSSNLSEDQEITKTTNFLLNILQQPENIEIRHNPIAVVEKVLIWLDPLEILSKNQREKIIDEYIEFFNPKNGNKNLKEDIHSYWSQIKGSIKDESKFKEEYINPIVRLMPPEVTWAKDLETKLIQKLLWDKSGNNLNNNHLHND